MALLDDIDPTGLEEFSVVFTDRSLNHMSATFQQVMRDISGMLKEVYTPMRWPWCPAAAPTGWRPWRGSSGAMRRCSWCATAGSPTAGARSSTRAVSRRDTS